jgi:hypothetical protein
VTQEVSASPTDVRRLGRWPAQVRMREKLATEAGRLAYELRKQMVEPVSGQIKACRGFPQFLLRGLASVGREWAIVYTVHNRLRLHRLQSDEGRVG